MEVATNFKIAFLCILTIILFNCSKESESTNEPPKNFEIEVLEILTTSAKLIWTASVDPEGSTVFYDVYLQGEKLIDNITELNFNLENLEEGVVYSGEIVASDPEGNTISVPYNFETSVNQPPTPFSVSVATSDPLFSRIDWTESTDPEGGNIIYSVYLEEVLVEENVNSLYHFFTDLKGVTVYTGYVEASDSDGKTYRANFSFVTELKVYDRDIRLENQSQLENFGHSCYNVIEGNLIIGSTNGSNLTDVSDLSSLVTLQLVKGDVYIQNTICENLRGLENIVETTPYGKLNIDNNDELLNLNGLEGITTMREIYIGANKKLLSFDGLNNLEVAYTFSFPYNESLNSIEGLQSLSSIAYLSISNNDALLDLRGLEKIKNIGRLAINGNDNLQSLAGLNNLETCGSIVIEANTKLPHLLGLDALNTVNTLYVGGNTQLHNLSGLENLLKITKSVTVQYNENLESLEGLNNMVFADGDSYGYGIIIYENGKITNLDVLSNITFVNGGLSVKSNPELIDFCGLTQLVNDLDVDGVNTNTIFRWNKFNPSYDDMLNGICSQ